MSEDRFFERLREDASRLRYQPIDGDPLWTRLPARVRAATERRTTVADVLAGWLRPLGASLAAIILAAVIGFGWTSADNASTIDLGSAPFDIAMAGD